MSKSKQAEQELIKDYDSMAKQLSSVYSNKSSDEYKMHGDITLSPSYKEIEKMVAELSGIKGFNRGDAREINTMFSTLHRPIFKQMVTDYLSKPTETNTIYTTVFTVGYRVLVGELSRILACTEAGDDGIKYKPDSVSRKSNSAYVIKHYNASMESGISAYIRANGSTAQKNALKNIKSAKIHQESAIGDAVAIGLNVASFAIDCIQSVFSFGAKEFNPISFFNAVLMKSYDKKVKKFEDAQKNYELAKEAYADYLRTPKSDRKRRIEHKYIKLINKYNIKMQNLKAKIEHFDQRSEVEARDKREKMKENEIISGSSDNDTSSTSSSGNGNAYDIDF